MPHFVKASVFQGNKDDDEEEQWNDDADGDASNNTGGQGVHVQRQETNVYKRKLHENRKDADEDEWRMR